MPHSLQIYRLHSEICIWNNTDTQNAPNMSISTHTGSSPVKRLSAGQLPHSPLQSQPLPHHSAASYSTSPDGQQPPASQYYYNPPPAGDGGASGGGQFYSGRRSEYAGMY